MERLTKKENGKISFVHETCPHEVCARLFAYENAEEDAMARDDSKKKLADLLKLCDYDRLLELAQADHDGLCVVLPVKSGGMVKLKGKDGGDPVKVDCINIYPGNRITFAFHEHGVKEVYVDDWSEDDSENYEKMEE